MTADRLKVLSAGAVKGGVAKIASDFGRAAGRDVVVEFTPVPEIRRRLAAGEAADVVVATPAVLDELARQGRLAADSRVPVGRSRMGVVVHAQATMPSLADTAAFMQVMRGASAVVYNEASSGVYAAKMLEKLGIAAEIVARTVVVKGGAAVMEYVAAHPADAVGLAQISEIMVLIRKGCAVKLAGPLPDEIQNVTSYEAAAMSGGVDPDASARLAHSFAAAEARAIFAATGID